MSDQEKRGVSAAQSEGARAGRDHASDTFSSGSVSEPEILATESFAEFQTWHATKGEVGLDQTDLQASEEAALGAAIESKSTLMTGKVPNPYLTAVEVALTPSEANKGEAEFLQDMDEFTAAFGDAARQEYADQFDDRLEGEFGPDPSAWQTVEEFEQRPSIDEAHNDILQSMERTEPAQVNEAAPIHDDFDIGE